jgi:hypothetical protein
MASRPARSTRRAGLTFQRSRRDLMPDPVVDLDIGRRT